MTTNRTRLLTIGVIAGLLCGAAAAYDVTVSITISGSVDELTAILNQLRNAGIEGGLTPEAAEALKLQMHSEVTGGEPAEAAPPKPALGFVNPAVAPGTVKIGEKALISVTVQDPDHLIDTIAARVGDVAYDLYDDGTHGDAQPLDGVWTREAEISADLFTGEHPITFQAYDANGETIMTAAPDGRAVPLSAQTAVTVAE